MGHLVPVCVILRCCADLSPSLEQTLHGHLDIPNLPARILIRCCVDLLPLLEQTLHGLLDTLNLRETRRALVGCFLNLFELCFLDRGVRVDGKRGNDVPGSGLLGAMARTADLRRVLGLVGIVQVATWGQVLRVL